MRRPSWTTALPVVAVALLAATWSGTLQEGGVHLVLFAAFLFLALNP